MIIHDIRELLFYDRFRNDALQDFATADPGRATECKKMWVNGKANREIAEHLFRIVFLGGDPPSQRAEKMNRVIRAATTPEPMHCRIRPQLEATGGRTEATSVSESICMT